VELLARILFLAALYIVTAGYVLGVFMNTWGFRGNEARYGTEALVSRTAPRPFSQRVLSPAIVRAGADLVPRGLVTTHADWLLHRSPLLRYLKRGDSLSLAQSVRYHVAYVYLFLCLLGVLLLARRLVQRFFAGSPLAADLAPAIALLFLPLTFIYGGYLYDFPELVFLLACFVLIEEGRWWALYPVFALALLNKEADILILVYAAVLGARQSPRAQLIKRLAGLAAVAAACLVYIRVQCLGVPGPPAELRLADNLRYWLRPATYLGSFSPIAPLIRLPLGANVLNLCALALGLKLAWRELPRRLQHLTIVLLPLEACLLLAFGYREELRALAPTFPVLFLVGLFAARRVYRVAIARGTGG